MDARRITDDAHHEPAEPGQVLVTELGARAPLYSYRILTGGCWNRVIAVEAGGRPLVIKISPHPAPPDRRRV